MNSEEETRTEEDTQETIDQTIEEENIPTDGNTTSSYEELMYSYSIALNEVEYLRAEIERCRRNERFSFFTNFINLFSTVLSLDPSNVDTNEVVATIQAQIRQTLARVHIQVFTPVIGEPCDVNRHQVISQVPATDSSQVVGTISRAFGVGFMYNDIVLARANVIIFSAPPEEQNQESAEDINTSEGNN